MKKDTSATIKRAERFQIIMIGEGLLIGVIAGVVILAYRLALEYAGHWLNDILSFVGRNPLRMAGWFVVLLILAWIVAKLVKYEPMISGSGIPQLEGEMAGKIDQTWWKVLPAKFLGGFLCLIGGLALGREGPSIQLGAMVGKGVSKKLDRGKTEEKYLLTCGASAGLAAAFHAPLAGVMFSLEEIHKNFSVSVLISVMTASLTADYIASTVTGMESVFQFEVFGSLPQEYYWMIILLGVILGFAGVFYNWFTLKIQELYNKACFLNTTTKIMVPFICAGVLAFTVPE
ncbi:MAG: ClC family H(+)/Cl(-) exchange transporter, partial [Dorea sp.]